VIDITTQLLGRPASPRPARRRKVMTRTPLCDWCRVKMRSECESDVSEWDKRLQRRHFGILKAVELFGTCMLTCLSEAFRLSTLGTRQMPHRLLTQVRIPSADSRCVFRHDLRRLYPSAFSNVKKSRGAQMTMFRGLDGLPLCVLAPSIYYWVIEAAADRPPGPIVKSGAPYFRPAVLCRNGKKTRLLSPSL